MTAVWRLGNAHTHTCLCDGADTPAEMAAQAYRLGFSALGFSGHSFCPGDGFGMQGRELAAYKRQVLAERGRYRGRMAVYLGLELDSMSPYPAADEFDYLIGSTHNILTPQGDLLPVDMSPAITQQIIAEHYRGDGLAYAAAYFRELDKMLTERRLDICGHFDLVCKYNAGGRLFDEAAPAYREMAGEVLRRHADKCAFEINTGAMYKGLLPRPYPDYWLWDILKETNARVIVNSDAHSTAGLDFGLAEQAAKARAFGLNIVTIEDICGEI